MNDQLESFSGWTARWWSYSVSHGRLTLTLQPAGPGKEFGTKYLNLFFCEHVSSPTEWLIHHLAETLIGEQRRVLEDHQKGVRFEYACSTITEHPLEEFIRLPP